MKIQQTSENFEWTFGFFERVLRDVLILKVKRRAALDFLFLSLLLPESRPKVSQQTEGDNHEKSE